MNASILNIGTELLVGHVLNTNANYLSKLLNSLGYNIYYHLACGDNFERTFAALDFLIERNDLIVITGGLGPTEDDITRDILAKYKGVGLVRDYGMVDNIKAFLEKNNFLVTENNMKQADCPEGGIMLKNSRGTAPGIVVEIKGCKIIALPGPPSEMKMMAEHEMMSHVQSTGYTLFSKFIRFAGIVESAVDQEINDMFKHQSDPTIGIYASYEGIMLRLSTLKHSQEEADKVFEPVVKQLHERLGEFIYSDDNEELEDVVVKTLKEKGLSVSFAESITGGKLAAAITSVSGASEVLKQSFVTYSNEAKIEILGVEPEVIENYGVVSAECALAMVKGLKERSGADICAAVTGFAGPSTLEGGKVGEVYIGYAFGDEIFCEAKRYIGDRTRIRNQVTKGILLKIVKLLRN